MYVHRAHVRLLIQTFPYEDELRSTNRDAMLGICPVIAFYALVKKRSPIDNLNVDCPGKTEPSEISADMPLVVSIFPPY
jgi:hypothetical protein